MDLYGLAEELQVHHGELHCWGRAEKDSQQQLQAGRVGLEIVVMVVVENCLRFLSLYLTCQKYR